MKISSLLTDMLCLFYPRLCTGCGQDIYHTDSPVCHECHADLPRTGFASFSGNTCEKIFYGRLGVEAAHSEFYFSGAGVIRHLIHELKYRSNPYPGIFLGRMLGESLKSCGRFNDIDLIIPLPLYPEREHRRGYNQARVIAQGISETFPAKPVEGIVVRKKNTESQTRKHRNERWLNVNEGFFITDPALISGKHILLVDDVITTGATLEACGRMLLSVSGTRLSIATLAMASK